MSPFEIFVVVAALIIIVRNFRKDRSDGRDALGGGGGSGGGSRRNTHLK